MKKLALLLASISLVGMNLYAGELKSFTSEAVMNTEDNGYKELELTVGAGTYQLNDKWNFSFDVDKNYITDIDKTKSEGWDTAFKLVQNLGKVKGWDTSITYRLDYDDQWNTETHEKSPLNQRSIYIFAPHFGKDIKIAEKDFSFGTEVRLQAGGYKGKTFDTKKEGRVTFSLNGDLTDYINLDLNQYNYAKYNSTDKDYKYTGEVELTLTYALPLKSGLSFNVENYFDGDYKAHTKGSYVEAYVKPQVKYTKEFSTVKAYGAIAYEVFSYEATKDEAGTPSKKSWANNEMELTLGFKTK